MATDPTKRSTERAENALRSTIKKIESNALADGTWSVHSEVFDKLRAELSAMQQSYSEQEQAFISEKARLERLFEERENILLERNEKLIQETTAREDAIERRWRERLLKSEEKEKTLEEN